MKRLLVIVFSFFYLISSSGVYVNLHYCGGKLKSIGLFRFSEKACCGKKMNSKGCCDNKGSFLKVKDDQNAHASIVVTANNSSQSILSYTFSLIYVNPFQELQSLAHTKAPPNLDCNSIFLVNRSIRI